MAWHLDLGNDAHETLACVGDDLTNVVLRVEAAVSLVVEDGGRRIANLVSDDGAVAPRADVGEARVLLDLDAPSLVVREMPVEGVHLMQREEVDVLLDELLRHEMACRVEMHAAPAEPRPVG